MLELITSIFGSYSPVTYEVYNTITESYDTVVAQGFAGVDWPYILAVGGFFLVLYCILRIVGGVLCGK